MKQHIYVLLSLLLLITLGCGREYNNLAPNISDPEMAEIAFNALAGDCDNLYTVNSAEEVPNVIIDIINHKVDENTELVFLIDKTGSMDDDIYEVKVNLTAIIDALPSGARLGAAAYGDALDEPDEWYDFSNLSSNFNTARSFITSIYTSGGGDAPESVYDGLYETLTRMSWTNEKDKIIILIGDAPDNERGKTIEEVFEKAKSLGVKANFYPILIKG